VRYWDDSSQLGYRTGRVLNDYRHSSISLFLVHKEAADLLEREVREAKKRPLT
jgi:hypothetical protein